MRFTGTISTSGTSYVIAIPKTIIDDLSLTKGSRVEIIFEDDKLIIPFKWKGLVNRCELILYKNLEAMASRMFDRRYKLHPFTYEIIYSIFAVVWHVYIMSYGYEHFKVNLIKSILHSLKKEDNLGDISKVAIEHNDGENGEITNHKIISVSEQIDEEYDPHGTSKEGLRLPKGHELNDINDYKTIKELKILAPKQYLKFLDKYYPAGGYLMLDKHGESDEASYDDIVSILEVMESSEFESFLDCVIIMEFGHHNAKKGP
jgi:antitoxin component of MazEF toxin-antitoxin module